MLEHRGEDFAGKGMFVLQHLTSGSKFPSFPCVSVRRSPNLTELQCCGCCCSVAQPCLALCDPMDCSTPGLPHHSPEFAQVHVHCIGNAIQPSHPLLPLPSIFPSIRDFSKEVAVHIRLPKYWSFSFSISPFNEYLGFISLKIDWFDLLVVEGTLRSFLQHHSLKALILQCYALFMM